MQFDIASLKETMAYDAAAMQVEQAVVAPSVQLREELFIRKIQQIGDEFGESVHLAMHAVHIGKALLVLRFPQVVLQQVEKSFEARQRRFQFMACHADKFIFTLFQFFELGDIVHNAHGRPRPAIAIHYGG